MQEKRKRRIKNIETNNKTKMEALNPPISTYILNVNMMITTIYQEPNTC